jgi:hypothetical protein
MFTINLGRCAEINGGGFPHLNAALHVMHCEDALHDAPTSSNDESIHFHANVLNDALTKDGFVHGVLVGDALNDVDAHCDEEGAHGLLVDNAHFGDGWVLHGVLVIVALNNIDFLYGDEGALPNSRYGVILHVMCPE